jgi:hypothetical protein
MIMLFSKLKNINPLIYNIRTLNAIQMLMADRKLTQRVTYFDFE